MLGASGKPNLARRWRMNLSGFEQFCCRAFSATVPRLAELKSSARCEVNVITVGQRFT